MSQQLRAVLAGCGGISRAWLDAIQTIPDVSLVGFVDIDLQAAQARAGQYGYTDVVIGADLTQVLTDAKPDIVFDCTVPEAHEQVTFTAFAHGCDVLGEKPMATSMATARRVAAAAQAAGRTYAVIQNRRYDPNIRRLAAFLAAGAIGDVTTVNVDFYIGAHFGGFRDHMRHVLLLDMAIHTFDAARLLVNGAARAVYCEEWNPRGSWYDRDASAVAIFEMDSEIVLTYRGSWCAEGLNTTWESDWRIVGTKGSVRWDGSTGFQAQVVAETGGFFSKWANLEVPPSSPEDRIGGHGGVIRDFVRCIQTGATPETVCTDNIKSLAMVFGAIESAEQRQRVQISD